MSDLVHDADAEKSGVDEGTQQPSPSDVAKPWRVWQDGPWTILHVKAGGAETTSSLTQDEAQALAHYLVQHHQPIPANEAKAREFLTELTASMEPPENPREEIERSARMLETYAVDLFPANPLGQVHMARAMMESAAHSIRQFLATLGDGDAKLSSTTDPSAPTSMNTESSGDGQ